MREVEVNFFGAVAMLRLVLPGMRRRQSGTIVNISSMDGIASLPVNGFYASSKFALEGMTEALWQELEPIGLRAFLVEPGSFRTGIEQRTRFSGEVIEAYEATSGAFRKNEPKLLSSWEPCAWALLPTAAKPLAEVVPLNSAFSNVSPFRVALWNALVASGTPAYEPFVNPE